MSDSELRLLTKQEKAKRWKLDRDEMRNFIVQVEDDVWDVSDSDDYQENSTGTSEIDSSSSPDSYDGDIIEICNSEIEFLLETGESAFPGIWEDPNYVASVWVKSWLVSRKNAVAQGQFHRNCSSDSNSKDYSTSETLRGMFSEEMDEVDDLVQKSKKSFRKSRLGTRKSNMGGTAYEPLPVISDKEVKNFFKKDQNRFRTSRLTSITTGNDMGGTVDEPMREMSSEEMDEVDDLVQKSQKSFSKSRLGTRKSNMGGTAYEPLPVISDKEVKNLFKKDQNRFRTNILTSITTENDMGGTVDEPMREMSSEEMEEIDDLVQKSQKSFSKSRLGTRKSNMGGTSYEPLPIISDKEVNKILRKGQNRFRTNRLTSITTGNDMGGTVDELMREMSSAEADYVVRNNQLLWSRTSPIRLSISEDESLLEMPNEKINGGVDNSVKKGRKRFRACKLKTRGTADELLRMISSEEMDEGIDDWLKTGTLRLSSSETEVIEDEPISGSRLNSSETEVIEDEPISGSTLLKSNTKNFSLETDDLGIFKGDEVYGGEFDVNQPCLGSDEIFEKTERLFYTSCSSNSLGVRKLKDYLPRTSSPLNSEISYPVNNNNLFEYDKEYALNEHFDDENHCSEETISYREYEVSPVYEVLSISQIDEAQVVMPKSMVSQQFDAGRVDSSGYATANSFHMPQDDNNNESYHISAQTELSKLGTKRKVRRKRRRIRRDNVGTLEVYSQGFRLSAAEEQCYDYDGDGESDDEEFDADSREVLEEIVRGMVCS